MSHSAYARCETRDRTVSLDQTEGQCRDKHNCSDEACPLEKKFGHQRFANALNHMAASIGQSFVRTTGR